MVIAAYILLAWLGLGFGSFVNALVWRLHEQQLKAQSSKLKAKKGNGKKPSALSPQPSAKGENLSIINGRSVCPHCRHQLAWYDLLPVVSWLWLRGSCRYCKKAISAQYPAVELALALVFTLSYAFWPVDLSGGQWVLFVTWLSAAIGLLALLVYDARFMLLPNRIIYPTLLVAVIGRLVYLVGFESHKLHALAWWGLSLLVASGIFWVIYVVSKGQWIGFGDVRLGWITGTLLATPGLSFLMVFLASLIGVIVILPALATGRKNLASRLPFGPFLIMAAAVAILFGPSILDWYQRTFLP